MRNLYVSLLLMFGAIISANAQDVKPCGQTDQEDRILKKFPWLADEIKLAEQELEDFILNFQEPERGGGERDAILTIPVVFHIIHNNGEENISDEQIHDAVAILNRDFRLQNEDLSVVHEAFIDLAADVEIEFRLAKKDPNGNCHKGINRVQSPLTTSGDSDMKALIFWPRNKYLNIWVCADAAGAAGYTQLPSSVNNAFAAPEDGIVVRHDYTGAIGTSTVTRSRTLTHEVGHWINLRHTWGGTNEPGLPSNCNTDDNVTDTPNTIGWTVCNINGESCGSLDNVQNYMEYSYCSRMFTQGQRTRMRNALQATTAQRNQLITASNHIATGIFDDDILCKADFYSNTTNSCAGFPIQFSDDSFFGIQSWTWDFGDGTTLSGNDPAIHKNPQHIYEQGGTYTVSLTVSDGVSDGVKVKENYVLILPDNFHSLPFQDGFETTVLSSDYTVENPGLDDAWQIVTAAAFTGTKSARLRNQTNSVEFNIDEMISKTYDFSGFQEVYIGWKWAYANKLTETDDRLHLMISTDCGQTWTLKKILRGFTTMPTAPATNASFVPTGLDQWSEITVAVNTPAQLVPSFRFKFQFEGRGGNNIYLDDINISGLDTAGTFVSDVLPKPEFLVYPNPAGDSFSIETGGLPGLRGEMTLIDYSGRQVASIYHGDLSSAGTIRFERGELASGLYFIVWTGNNGAIVAEKIRLE